MAELLVHEAVDAALSGRATGWRREGDALVLDVDRGDFAGALAFVDAVGARAEVANHHPDVDIRWSRVTLRLSTHSAGGLTQKDLDLAREVDVLLEQGNE
ncbi:MAG: 4a-hydroxytetrahydrobiopterin dehydratase [Acidimicrobiales bacterium]